MDRPDPEEGRPATGAPAGARRTAVVVAVVVAVVALGAVVASVLFGGDDDDPAATPDPSEAPGSTGGATGMEPVPTTEATPTAAAATYTAACDRALDFTVTPGVEDPNLVEVSGIAVDDSGVAWVVNDSGDRPRVYGVRPDGTVQTVEVTGAEAIDWEDIAIQRAGGGSVLWIADTGSNIEPRETVQVYRVPVPAPADTSVAAERLDVTYRDGSHDVEALMVEPDGTLVLVTKDPGRAGVYRVVPAPSGDVDAERVGDFEVGDGERTVVSGADLSADGSTVVLRTYGSVFLVPVDPGRPLIDALADRDAHCRGIPPMEIQGESVAFLPDGSGYVTMGEGRNPYLTTVRVP